MSAVAIAQRPSRTARTVTPPLRKGRTIAPGYRVIEHLSRGEVLDVYDVWDEERACRCIAKAMRPERGNRRRRARLVREGRLLKRFSHPHLVRAYEVVYTPDPVVILETLTGETLAHHVARCRRRLALTEVAILGTHLCSAIQYMHRNGFLHLDLKPSNVVEDAGRAKVLDLSLARRPGRGRPGMGTRQYMAPEQARGGELGPPADVWGIGAVLYEAATGREPFEYLGGSRYGQLERVADPVNAYRRVPPAFGRLVHRCLDPDPALRPSVPELSDSLYALAG